MHQHALYLPIAVDSSPGPQPPTGVSVDTLGDESVDVSWNAQQSMQCDVVIGNYSVRYQQRNAFTAGYTAIYSNETNVALQELGPGTNYRVSVASITSNGEMSAYSNWVQFTTAMATPSQCERERGCCSSMPACNNIYMAAYYSCVSRSVACPCSPVGACVGAAGGGFIGGVLLTAAIATCLACTVFYRIRANRGVTAKRE